MSAGVVLTYAITKIAPKGALDTTGVKTTTPSDGVGTGLTINISAISTLAADRIITAVGSATAVTLDALVAAGTNVFGTVRLFNTGII